MTDEHIADIAPVTKSVERVGHNQLQKILLRLGAKGLGSKRAEERERGIVAGGRWTSSCLGILLLNCFPFLRICSIC